MFSRLVFLVRPVTVFLVLLQSFHFSSLGCLSTVWVAVSFFYRSCNVCSIENLIINISIQEADVDIAEAELEWIALKKMLHDE